MHFSISSCNQHDPFLYFLSGPFYIKQHDRTVNRSNILLWAVFAFLHFLHLLLRTRIRQSDAGPQLVDWSLHPAQTKIKMISNLQMIESSGSLGDSSMPLKPPLEDYESLIRPDFQILSKEYPQFAEAWTNLRASQRIQSSENWKSPDAKKRKRTFKPFSNVLDHTFNVALTRALLHKYFHLHLPRLPEGTLCPPVPNRFHYVQWIRTLVRQMYDYADEYFISNEVGHCRYKGLDIGCGASAIYLLLLSTPSFTESLITPKEKDELNLSHSWKFLGTDINADSVQCAKDNVLGKHDLVHIH